MLRLDPFGRWRPSGNAEFDAGCLQNELDRNDPRAAQAGLFYNTGTQTYVMDGAIKNVNPLQLFSPFGISGVTRCGCDTLARSSISGADLHGFSTAGLYLCLGKTVIRRYRKHSSLSDDDSRHPQPDGPPWVWKSPPLGVSVRIGVLGGSGTGVEGGALGVC